MFAAVSNSFHPMENQLLEHRNIITKEKEPIDACGCVPGGGRLQPFSYRRALGRERICSQSQAAMPGAEDVYAECDKTAAAQAYFEAVGQHRARKLRELGAPPFIIAAETELDRIESALCSVSFLREPAYLLDNLAEAWLITINVESVEDGPFGIHSNGKDLPHVN